MIIFDFDLTLVDTQPVEALRAARRWRSVIDRAPDLEVYDGIHELIRELDACDEPLAIVTKSPNMVPRFFVKEHKWPIGIVLGYHQVKRRKPDPEALILAMRKAGAEPENTFHVGDQPEDTEASRAAGVTAIGAGWGLDDTRLLEASEPDHLFMWSRNCGSSFWNFCSCFKVFEVARSGVRVRERPAPGVRAVDVRYLLSEPADPALEEGGSVGGAVWCTGWESLVRLRHD